MTDLILYSKPFDWNDNLSEEAIEDFETIRGKLTYCQHQSIGMALAKLELLEKQGCKVIDPSGSSSEKPNKWIPIKTRPLTNKEKEEYADLGYSEDSIDSMYDCPLPEDGEEVLITTRYDEVTTDTFYRDEGCYFETYCDKDDVKAWMQLPKPYKAEGSGEE